jgi:hypothetical protein
MVVGFAMLLICGINVTWGTDILCVRFYVLSPDIVNTFFPKTGCSRIDVNQTTSAALATDGLSQTAIPAREEKSERPMG